MTELDAKYERLLDWFREAGSVAIGYSGGVDSAFLLAVAKRVLPDQVLAVIGLSPTYPRRELEAARALAATLGAEIVEIETHELEDEGFRQNPPTRCFACKHALFSGIWEVARSRGIKCVVEGSNQDDLGDFRPGMDAAAALGVKAPLVAFGFTKDEIRALSKRLGLPTWSKPALACLSSRIPYGEEISVERLGRIERAEDALLALGLSQLRVRDHGQVARIEVEPAEIPALAQSTTRERIVRALKDAGYGYVCLDLEGYRRGAMNEALSLAAMAAARCLKGV